MVKISYVHKKKKSHFIISFRNRPTQITNIIINTVNIARLFYFPSLHNKYFQLTVGYLEKNKT